MNVNRLNWNNLRVFLTLARTGNLSQAGRVLGVDHATVGRRLAALEYDLGTPLFERDHAGYRLNIHGRAIFAHVESMEASVLAATEQLESGGPAPSGRVRIATMEGIASLYLSEQFTRLRQLRPGIVIELVTSPRDIRISQREADIFLGFYQPFGDNLDIVKIGQFACHLYASPGYLAERGVPESVEALSDHVFVGYIDDLIQLNAVRWLEDAIVNPTITFHSSSMLSQMFAAAAGAGLVMLPVFSRPERFGLVQVLGNQLDVRRSVWMSTHQLLRRVPRISAVMSFLTETFARDYPA
jgi:DNA-binding transcriptional LysR family regulator